MSFKNVDYSDLPEEIRSHILSLMPTKFAVQTSILSKRWRYTWMFVTNLDFGDIHTIDSLHSLTKVVDRLLKFCRPSQVKLFRLRFPVICARTSRVSNWIDDVVRLNISELDLRVHQLQLPPSLFTCKTLTKLRLDPSGYDSQNVWEFKCPVNLPCLKTLDITVFANPFVNACKLINGCPMLENLSLEVTVRAMDEENYAFNIPTLKRLKLTWFKYVSLASKIILNVPNLEYLFVGGVLCWPFVMQDVSSLVEASLSFRDMPDNQWVELLKGLSGVKSLKLSVDIITAIMDFNSFTSPLPIFPNMKHLELDGFWRFGSILKFLEISPELKHLCITTFLKEPEEYIWVEPELVPACMLTNLTTIKFSICKWWKCDIPFLKYMLGNTEVLKMVIITWQNSSIEEEKLCAELVKRLPRTSSDCEIHFYGNCSPTIMQ